nr:unnamed protein product [Naegleria fowleri]
MSRSPPSPTRRSEVEEDQQQLDSPTLLLATTTHQHPPPQQPKTPPIPINSNASSSLPVAGSLKTSSLKHHSHSSSPSSHNKKTVTFTPIESSILAKNLKDQEDKKTSNTSSNNAVMVAIEDDEPPSTKYYQIGDDDENEDNSIKLKAKTTPTTSPIPNTSQPGTPRSTKSSSKKKKPIVFNHTVLTWFRTQRQSLKQRRANATPEDMLSTGPLTKFWKYGKIPWKMMIQIVLVMLITVEVVLLSQHRNYFFISSDASFANQFLKDGYENYEQSLYGFYTSYFYNAQEVVDDISKTVSTKNVDIWVFPRDTRQRDLIKPVRIDIKLFKDNPRLFGAGDYGREPFIVESDILTKREPLGVILKSYLQNSTRDFFDRLYELTLTINLVGLDRSNYAVNNYAECVFWTLKKIYKNGEGGRLMSQLHRTYDVCRTTDRALYMEFFKPAIWMSLLIFLFSMVALVLDIKAIVARVMLFKKIRDLEVKKQGIKNEYTQSGNSITRFFQRIVYYRVNHLSLSDIPKILSYWVLFSISQHCVNILTFILQLSIPGKTIEVSFFVGLGALLTWSSTIRFFQFSPNFYMFSKAFERGLPQVIRFIITTLPLYFGFALFGEYSKYFFDINEAMVTLFSLIFQDNMRDTFDSVFGYQGFTAFFSRFYIYIYTTIFICVIANVFTSIMEDAFFSLKENQENLEKQVNKNAKDDEASSTSSGESDVSIINVSINDLSEDAEDGYLQQVIKKEEQKEQKIICVKEQYFPQDGYTSLKYILDEESIKDNVNRIVTIVKTLCKDKNLSEEDQQLLKSIESKAVSIYSKTEVLPGLHVDQEELQAQLFKLRKSDADKEENSDLFKTKED